MHKGLIGSYSDGKVSASEALDSLIQTFTWDSDLDVQRLAFITIEQLLRQGMVSGLEDHPC